MKHTNLLELTKSQMATRLGIKNEPNEEQIKNLELVVRHIFDPLREHFGVPLSITSGFRCNVLNNKIGGAKTSQHTEGKALDIDADVFGGVSNKEIFDWIKENCEFDQLIWEYGDANNPAWVHASYNEGKNRKQILKV